MPEPKVRIKMEIMLPCMIATMLYAAGEVLYWEKYGTIEVLMYAAGEVTWYLLSERSLVMHDKALLCAANEA